MANMIEAGVSYLVGAMAAAAASIVSLTRDYGPYSSTTSDVTATIGSSEFDAIDLGGVLIDETRTVDFMIQVSDYIIAGEIAEPARGDVVTTTYGTTDVSYVVSSPGGGRPAWQYSDRGRSLYRIHTTEITET